MSESIEQRALREAGRYDFEPHVDHNFADGLYAKEIHIPQGHEIISHKHHYDHFSILARGAVVVKTDDAPPQTHTAPACITIRAGVHHAVEALIDATWYCIHATSEQDPERVDRVLIRAPNTQE